MFLLKILKFYIKNFKIPAALTLKEVNTYSAISVHLLFRDGNSQSSMWLLATLQLPFTKLCVVVQDCTVHLSGMEEEEDERGEEWEMRIGEEDETGGSGRGGGKRGRPKKTDATTVAMAFWDINSPEPHCANLIGNVSAAMLCHHHTLASK